MRQRCKNDNKRVIGSYTETQSADWIKKYKTYHCTIIK